MKIIVITDEAMKEELLAQRSGMADEVIWVPAPCDFHDADACIDLLFTPEPERIKRLIGQEKNIPVLINDVTGSLKTLPVHFTRINGWKSFLKRPVTEVAAKEEAGYAAAEKVLAVFGKSAARVPDLPGMVAARVVSMIINEAWLTLEEGISTSDAVDTAMKLGTNYPYGPFEWGNIIGLKQVCHLLEQLAVNDPRYTPSALLKKEAYQS